MVSRVKDQKDGKVNYVEFLQLLNVTMSPGDVEGVSTQIYHNSISAEEKRLSEHRTRWVEPHHPKHQSFCQT